MSAACSLLLVTAAGRPHGGRAADFGKGRGGLLDIARAFITPTAILETPEAVPRGDVSPATLLRCFRHPEDEE